MLPNSKEANKLIDILNEEIKGIPLDLKLDFSFLGIEIKPMWEDEFKCPIHVVKVEEYQRADYVLRKEVQELVKRYKEFEEIRDFFNSSNTLYNNSELAVALMTDKKIELYHNYHDTKAITVIIQDGKYSIKSYNYYKKEIKCSNIHDLKESLLHYTRDFYLSRFKYLIADSYRAGASFDLIESIFRAELKSVKGVMIDE